MKFGVAAARRKVVVGLRDRWLLDRSDEDFPSSRAVPTAVIIPLLLMDRGVDIVSCELVTVVMIPRLLLLDLDLDLGIVVGCKGVAISTHTHVDCGVIDSAADSVKGGCTDVTVASSVNVGLFASADVDEDASTPVAVPSGCVSAVVSSSVIDRPPVPVLLGVSSSAVDDVAVTKAELERPRDCAVVSSSVIDVAVNGNVRAPSPLVPPGSTMALAYVAWLDEAASYPEDPEVISSNDDVATSAAEPVTAEKGGVIAAASAIADSASISESARRRCLLAG